MLSVLLIVVLCLPLTYSQLNGVFLFGQHYKTFTFDCQAGFFAGITPNGKGMTFYDVVEEHFIVTYNFTQPGALIGIPRSGYRVVVAHDTTYLTVLDSGDMTTDYIPTRAPSSLILVKDLACLLPSELAEGMAIITCMNLTTVEHKECMFDKHLSPNSRGYVNEIHGWVYILNHDSTADGKQNILKYVVQNGCLVFQKQSLRKYLFGEHAWFSADGSSIFLENGKILVSSNTTDDMTVRNYSFAPSNHFLSFSQPGDTKHRYIAAIDQNTTSVLKLYSWPEISLTKKIKIPLTKNITRVEPCSIYYCTGYNGLILVFGQFQLTSGKIETGVSYINMID